MKVIVNGSEKVLKAGATLKDAVAGEIYHTGSEVSIILSTERIRKESNNFEIETEHGTMVMRLDDSDDGKLWRSMIDSVTGSTLRWVTHNIVAFGSFPTKIKANDAQRMYRTYDCFFSLGGRDNSTTYMMIAREDHKWSYSAGPGRIGRITRGRHLVKLLREGDAIKSIRPTVSEHSTENSIVTSDMKYKLEDGMTIDTYVKVELNSKSPMSSEHLLVTTEKGYISISDASGSYAACSDNMDMPLDDENKAVREIGNVSVRTVGTGAGRIFMYRERRQMIPFHNNAGTVTHGMRIASMVSQGQTMTVETVPKRIISIGKTQAEGEKFLKAAGIRQIRTGDTSDDAIIVEQEPEMTMEVIKSGETETFGVQKDKIFRISLNRKKAPEDCHYFEIMTGLNHKSIGTMKVHFTYKDIQFISFEGSNSRGKSLYPQDEFKKCKKGDLGLTNQAGSYPGLMGIRLADSNEYGPTAEEPYATNIFGRLEDDLAKFMEGQKNGNVVYITEMKL